MVQNPRGVGVADRTAILVEPNGVGTVVREGAVYFFQAPGKVDVIKTGAPLTYLGITVQQVSPNVTFNFSKWRGGVASVINVKDGVLEPNQAKVY